MKYAQILKELREERGYSQEGLAQVLGTTQQYYGKYENGIRELPFSRAIELAKFYNVSLDYIAGLIILPERLDRFEKK